MKKNVFITCFFAAAYLFSSGQSTDYKVVFDLTSKDTIDQKSIIRWINEILTASPDAQIEVVMYAQGLALAVKDRSYVPNAVTQLSNNKNVSFKVCAIAMKNQHVDNSQLLTGVQTVPDGIYEIISKQRQGWGYIKASH